MTNWVEDALDETISWIKDGAHPLEVDPTTQKALKDGYREDYTRQYEAGRRWED